MVDIDVAGDGGMMSQSDLERYLILRSQREKPQESVEDERLLDLMDELWWRMTDEERAVVERDNDKT